MPDSAGPQRAAPHVLRQIGLWASIALIVAISALSYISIRALVANAEEAQRTRRLMGDILLLVSDLKDAQIGQRGFLITGIEEYLQPYSAALEAVPRRLAALRERLEDEPQRRRLDEIERHQRRAFDLLALDIAARRTGGLAQIDSERMAQGKLAVDRIRGLVAEMVIAESARLTAADRAARRGVAFTVTALAVGTFASVAVIALVFYRANREAVHRRRAEEEARALNAALEARVAARTADLGNENTARRESEELLRAIIEESPFAVVGLDPHRNVVAWNRAAERIFGYTAAEVIGRPYPLVPADGQAEFDDIMRRTAAGERLQAFSVQRRHKSGKLVDVTFAGAPLYASDGRLRGMVFLLEDVSEKRSMERQLRQAQRMEAVGQLTGGLAHDFNNILSVVVGNLDLLVDELAADTKRRALAESAMKGALRGAELVQRLLAFARRQPLSPRPVDLNERLPGLAALLQRTLGERIEVRTVPGNGLWPAIADPAQFEDALLNLAINARDAMPKGGTLTIETANVRLDETYAAANPEAIPGDYVMAAVTDTGTGMPPDVVERAFEPFFTTKETGKGSGLGLSMVYGFVRQSRGHVKIYSEVGHGTSIKIYLPRSDMAAETAVAETARAALPRGNERVLLVEDNAGVREAAERTLGELGYRVTAMPDAAAAMAWLERGEPVDLLFTDLVMPGAMNGRDLAVAASAKRPDLKIVLTTGYAEGAIHNGGGNGKRNGNGLRAHFIGKPYRKADLARTLRNALAGETNEEGNR